MSNTFQRDPRPGPGRNSGSGAARPVEPEAAWSQGLKADIAAGRPPSPADILHEQQAAADARRRDDLDAALRDADAEVAARRISGV